jgi:4-amino-4-deoxy-L-arabinose transferase-like glycosyltransferase
LAAVYAVLGVSEASALLTEVAFLFLLAWGAFRLSRHWLEPPSALAVALLLIGAPELAFWGRQIMLHVPAYAFLVWAAEFLVRHLQSGQRWSLFAAVICVMAAGYTKFNAIFFVAPIAISLAYAYGWRVLRQRVVLQAAALGGALLLPLVGIFFAFGSYNLDQAAALRGAESSRWSIAELSYLRPHHAVGDFLAHSGLRIPVCAGAAVRTLAKISLRYAVYLAFGGLYWRRR